MIPVSVAPMMDRTDRHFRAFLRVISQRALLYTEMVTTGAVLHGDRDHLLGFSPGEHPVALQLGGDDPVALATCARIAEDFGYDEVNLNVGCPSDRVQKGRFGACLMRHPEVVAEAVAAMRAAVGLEITVKHRIGVDELDAYEDMERFVTTVAQAGCRRFTVHARKAWLSGLSPKENRTIPPLRYDDVYRLKRAHPALEIEINGGITTLDAVRDHLEHVDAVMIGRAAVDDPWLFHGVDPLLGHPSPTATREAAARAMIPYVDGLGNAGEPSHRVTRHMLNLFAGQPGARGWKRVLTERGREHGGAVIEAALAAMFARRPAVEVA
ncbi:MAG: tRNA dihydrouridine(20/20a) synthase DusA [Alphaproteobacteria bacterium]|nr:tRNA dihydrouridine(20/20a) synthase DusA [Alphaproteobacteria bacterium]